MIMKHWIEKKGEVIAVFETQEHASIFLEVITEQKKENFENEKDFYRTVFKLGYEQYYGEIELNK